MKKMGLWVCLVFLFVAVSGAAAEEGGAAAKDKKVRSLRGEKKGSHQMKAMMMGKMMEKKLVATSDGGVVVLFGRKLMKYDKDLVLKAEAEIKIDKAEWKKMMEHCPMGRKGKAKGGEGATAEAVSPAEDK